MKPFEKVEKSLQPKERILASANLYGQGVGLFVYFLMYLGFFILAICLTIGKIELPDSGGLRLMLILYAWFLAGMLFICVIGMLFSGNLRRGKYLVITNQRIMGLTNSFKKHSFNYPIDKLQQVTTKRGKLAIVIDSKTYKFVMRGEDRIAKIINQEISRIAEEKEKKEKQMQAALMAAAMRGNYIPPQ